MIILQDSHEKMPWSFEMYRACSGQEVSTLKTGDYTIKDTGNLIVVERKRNSGELAINLGKKYQNFRKEFERMQEFRFRHLVCEFPMTDLSIFPVKSGIPKNRWPYLRINGKYIYAQLLHLCEEFGVEYHFCDDRFAAETKAMELLVEAYDIFRKLE